MWSSGDNFWESFLSLLGSGDQIQVTRLSGKLLYPLGHLTGPVFSIFTNTEVFHCGAAIIP